MAGEGHPTAGAGPRRNRRKRSRRLRWTLVAGAALILVSEAMLAIDLCLRDAAVAGHGRDLGRPESALGLLARQAAVNMTPLCWAGYLLLMDGLLDLVGPGASPARRRPRRFAWCFLTSVPIWLLFDWINFSFIHAWDYHNLPPNPMHRYLGYFVAFGAITPAMLLSAELISRLWTGPMRGPRIVIGAPGQWTMIVVGLAAVALPFVVRAPVASVPLWLAMPLVCDAINAMLGAPSVVGDLRQGRWGRPAALMAGGLWCGLLWEFWNYWAAAKWTYDLGFLGAMEHVRYFEMPVPGLLGFLPFGVGCWAAFVTIVWVVGRVRLPSWMRPEPLPDQRTIL